jgi:hypothetical protein
MAKTIEIRFVKHFISNRVLVEEKLQFETDISFQQEEKLETLTLDAILL